MAAIRSFVKIKPFASKTPIGTNFNEIRKGINRQGVLVEGIGQSLEQSRKIVEFEREFLRSNTQKTLTRVDEESKSKETFAKRMQRFYGKLFEKKRRQKAEDAAEKGDKEAKKDNKKFVEKIKKPVKGFLQALGGILGTVAKYFIIFGVLDWLEKNPESATKLFRLIFHIGKFAYNITSLGIGAVLDGLTNMFGDFSADGINENIVKRSFRFLFGAFQLLGGVAALKAAQYIMMPWKLMQDINFVRGIFSRQAAMEAESEVSREKRMTGYRDKKSGVIYTKEEVEQMRKSAQRADAKRAKKAGKGMKSTLYEDALKDRLQGQYGRRNKGPLGKLQQRGRIASAKMGKGFKNFAKANPGKISGAFSILGGATRIAGGLAAGESAGKAVGAGVGQAAGGVLGAAAGTALLGPFLGPFAPMVGSAIGSFLGEWVGGELGPLMEPIFGPIKRYFGMMFKVVQGVFGEVFQPIKEAFSALFDFIGQLGSLIMEVAGILKKFADFVLGPVFHVIGKTVEFIVSNAKRLMDPMSVVKGYADMMTFNLFNFDGMAAGGPIGQYAAGGVFATRLDKKREKVLDALSDDGDNGFLGVLKVLTETVAGLFGKKGNQQGATNSSGGGSTSGTPSGGGTTPSGGGYTGDPGNIAASGSVVQKGVEISKKIMSDTGATKEAAAAIAGNMAHESAGFVPGIREGGPFGRSSKPWPKGTVGKGYGWAQWTNHRPGGRYDAFIKSFGGDYNKIPTNADNYKFLMQELSQGNGGFIAKGAGTSGSYSEFKKKTDVVNATVDFRKTWERAGVAHDESRIKYAQQFLQQLASGGKVINGVPYLNQRANKADKYGRPGDTQCYSTTMAMWASQLLNKSMSSEEYNKIRSKYGISTQAEPQRRALRDLGIDSSLRTGGKWSDLRGEIDAGYPIPVGFKYKGSGHWGMVVGYKNNGFVVHDPFGQLGMGGTWKKTNSAADKTNGPGKYYFMDKNLFQNQLPDGDVWWWKAPRAIKPSTQIGDGKDIESTTSEGQVSETGDGSGANTGGQAEPLNLEQSVDKLFESFEGDFRKAFMNMMGSTDLDVSKKFGLRSLRGDALESATKQRAMISESEITGTKVKQFVDLQNKVRRKAQRDKDRANFVAPPAVITTTVQQPIINNRGGAVPNITWTKPSPLLTHNK